MVFSACVLTLPAGTDVLILSWWARLTRKKGAIELRSSLDTDASSVWDNRLRKEFCFRR